MSVIITLDTRPVVEENHLKCFFIQFIWIEKKGQLSYFLNHELQYRMHVSQKQC